MTHEIVAEAPFSRTHGKTVGYAKSIEELAREIELRSDRGDASIVRNARLMKELKSRVEAGEAGPGVRFLEWAFARFKLHKSQVYRLIAIAEADDPYEALKQFRFRENLRQKNYRAGLNNGAYDPQRAAVIKLVRHIEISQVQKVRKYICDLTGM